MTAALYPGEITHARATRSGAVRYRSYLWLADLDDLPAKHRARVGASVSNA